jgi:hypothetical protein
VKIASPLLLLSVTLPHSPEDTTNDTAEPSWRPWKMEIGKTALSLALAIEKQSMRSMKTLKPFDTW